MRQRRPSDQMLPGCACLLLIFGGIELWPEYQRGIGIAAIVVGVAWAIFEITYEWLRLRQDRNP